MTREELKSAAMAMRKRAYCPYSHFAVGAARNAGTARSLPDATLKTQAIHPPSAPSAPRWPRPSARATPILSASP